MKKIKSLLAILCCLALLFGMAGCATEPTDQTDEELFSGFTSELDYVGENGENLECSILLEALEGSFKADVTAEDITVKVQEITDEERTEDFDPEKEYADVSEVKLVSGDDTTLEVSFVIPKGELNAEEFAMEGYVALADGVMLDADGKTVGKMAELTVWEMNESDRAGNTFVEHDYEYSKLTLEHNGWYVADFYVSWDELVGYDFYGNPMVYRRYWDENGHNVRHGYHTVIFMKNASNILIEAREETGLIWENWRTMFEQDNLNFKTATLTISGTTLLNPEANFEIIE